MSYITSFISEMVILVLNLSWVKTYLWGKKNDKTIIIKFVFFSKRKFYRYFVFIFWDFLTLVMQFFFISSVALALIMNKLQLPTTKAHKSADNAYNQ